MIKAWSATQKVIALSSGEAEYYGLVKGASMAKGTQAIMMDMGLNMKIRSMGHDTIHTDSSAAKGIATRKGLGKVRHIEISQLWVQQEVSSGRITIVKVKGTDNMANILTKHVDNATLNRHCNQLDTTRSQDIHELNPDVAIDAKTTNEKQ